LEGLLDRYAEDRPTVRSAYRRAMQLELAFFDAYATHDPAVSSTNPGATGRTQSD
jgi:hypothetical protein